MDKVIKLGIVGFGRIVELVHLPLLKQVPEIEVHGVFDITPQRLDLAARRGFDTYTRLEDLLSSPVDAILVATPPSSHYSVAGQALQYGKHVLIEKPVTVTGIEALALQQTAQQAGRMITVFQNRRFDADYLLVKQVISGGLTGPILFVERRCHRFSSGAAFGVKSFHPEWRNETAYGGGALMDWGVHLVDQLLGLELGNCLCVSARMHNLRWKQGEVDDYVHSFVELDNGIIMSFEINFGSHAAAPLWVIGGENATLQIMSEKEAYILEKGKSARQIPFDTFPQGGSRKIYTSFADCLLRGGELEVSMEQAVKTMQILDAIRQSAEEKREVDYGDFIRGSTGGI